ncbi:ribosome maturation factor RimM [Schaalia sp. 19OD2882]|uniref:ribosome maturation factor RimM n=1 Tax=Schaalia sp. 19OD2882 TaxID=2794089 RepID=UPI001C1EB433|nr:ribosome maturation factor RimM [Schaalia sp. 19OD2882]QWW18824.1 ribosome maturation factor RimM [Schaalia sp. 19OD2882]
MRLTAAVIGPAHGLRGEAILDIRTDDPDLVVPGAVLDTTSDAHPRLTVESVRSHKERVLVAFEELLTREDVEAERGTKLLVEERDEDDAWYPHQLKGLSALTVQGDELGTVTGLRPGAAQDLLLVRTADGRTVMVPFVTQLVPVVDIVGGRVVIDAPGGLFDDDVSDGADGGAR